MAGASVVTARPPPVFNKPLVFRDRKIQSFFAKVGAVVHSDILGGNHPEWIPVIGYNHRYIDYLQTFYRVTGFSCSGAYLAAQFTYMHFTRTWHRRTVLAHRTGGATFEVKARLFTAPAVCRHLECFCRLLGEFSPTIRKDLQIFPLRH